MKTALFIFLFFYFNRFYTFADIYDESECNQALLRKSALKATSSLPERGPKNAELYGSLN